MEWRYSSATSALDGGEWPASRPCHFTPRETAPAPHCIEGRVDPRAGVDAMEKRLIFCSYREPNPDSLVIQPVA
jgi:hypothetical protein